MPGSLSNEDEGQDDMDFEDEMPGEVKGEAGCPSHYFAPRRLECGQKGLSCVSETTEEGKEGGVQNQSHAILLYSVLLHDSVFKVGTLSRICLLSPNTGARFGEE